MEKQQEAAQDSISTMGKPEYPPSEVYVPEPPPVSSQQTDNIYEVFYWYCIEKLIMFYEINYLVQNPEYWSSMGINFLGNVKWKSVSVMSIKFPCLL